MLITHVDVDLGIISLLHTQYIHFCILVTWPTHSYWFHCLSFHIWSVGRTHFIQSHCIFHLRTAQKLKFSIKDFFSKCDQIRTKLWICSHLLKKSLMESFIFCAVMIPRKSQVCFSLVSDNFLWSVFQILLASCVWILSLAFSHYILSLREKCPNTEFFLVRIFQWSDQKKLRIWTLFTQYTWSGLIKNSIALHSTYPIKACKPTKILLKRTHMNTYSCPSLYLGVF